MGEGKGIALVIGAAVVSGVSIFLNKFGVSDFNPFIFTTLKNALVAVFLFSTILLLGEYKNLRSMRPAQWGRLALIGLVGGSIPFLLFFYGLKLTSAVNAGFLHKTLFIWVMIFAAVFLKEGISRKFLAGALLLLAGNSILFSKFTAFGTADAMILAAAVLWGAENVISKKALGETYGRIVAFGRMFFGSLFMLAFLAITGQAPDLASLSAGQVAWVLVTGGMLFLYVLLYYTGLKYVRVSVAAALLSLAQPITAMLPTAFSGSHVSAGDAFGFLLILAGSATIIGFGYIVRLGEFAAAKVFRMKGA